MNCVNIRMHGATIKNYIFQSLPCNLEAWSVRGSDICDFLFGGICCASVIADKSVICKDYSLRRL